MNWAITVGVPNWGIGASVGGTATFGSDCTEGVAAACWGYAAQAGGLGTSIDPTAASNKLEKESAAESDPASPFCPDIPNLMWSIFTMEDHIYTLDKSYDTGWVTQSRSSSGGNPVVGEWTGKVFAQTAGIQSGARALARLDDWFVTAEVKEVEFVPSP